MFPFGENFYRKEEGGTSSLKVFSVFARIPRFRSILLGEKFKTIFPQAARTERKRDKIPRWRTCISIVVVEILTRREKG